jgi:hypothetical protein
MHKKINTLSNIVTKMQERQTKNYRTLDKVAELKHLFRVLKKPKCTHEKIKVQVKTNLSL